MLRVLLAWALLFFSSSLVAQQPLHIPLNIKSAYEKQTRDVSGQPGVNYWQNSSTYQISVKLEPDSGKITGMETVSYKNNSPDTLNELVISLLSDIIRKGNKIDFNIPLGTLTDGVQITRLKVNGNSIDMEGSQFRRNGTNVFLALEKGLLPGEKLKLEMDWHFIYPRFLTIRCGDYGDSTFFVAYFYPKIAVYDDLDGWDRNDYTGFTEFYGDFNDYFVDITVPKNFKVWATGELMNANAVFTKKYYEKWREAQESMEVYSMIDKENFLDDDITRDNEWNTWQFRAENVTDFAYGTSDKFLWDVINVVVDEKTGRKTTFNSAYRVDSEDYYKMAELGKKVLTDYSTRIPGIPYPFPEMTIFNGNSGMEFPMMCNNVSCETWDETAGLAYHEVAHTYFPFFVGTNERKYAWMDEGWASLLPYFYFEEHSPDVDYFKGRMNRYYGTAGEEIEVPMMTLSHLLTVRKPYRQASYNKSYFAYYYLYEYLGKELFTKSLQSYMNAWAGKHPMPYDYFNAINTATGKNLNWYWQNWFFDINHADLALTGLSGNGNELIIKNTGGLFVPIILQIEYKDGTVSTRDLGLNAWQTGPREVHVELERIDEMERIVLGGDKVLDVDTSNNTLKF